MKRHKTLGSKYSLCGIFRKNNLNKIDYFCPIKNKKYKKRE